MTKRSAKCQHCGGELAATTSRSAPQLRQFFWMIALAFANWPETHEHQFASTEELRAWLTMKAGAREVGAAIPLHDISRDVAMLVAEAAIRGAGSYAMPVMHGDILVIFRPKSISFAKMPHHAFCQLSDDVADIIDAETGMGIASLMQEAKRATADG
jgi:hypothetical protein